MLKQINGQPDTAGACLPIAQAKFPSPFATGLEYGAPARGVWNIVHTGMLIPQAHEIFVCAANCLRGVVLTAAEMGASHRFSTVTIKERNVLEGDMESLIIEGVSDILHQLPKMPPAVLVYTSCIHHFMACDLDLCYRQLRSRFPGVDFTDCYMNPIMRKSGLTPDQIMRKQLYSLLKPCPLEANSVNLIGNNMATQPTSDLVGLLQKNGILVREITGCHTYEDYQQMARSKFNITYHPAAVAAGESLEKRLGQTHLYLPLSYAAEEIRAQMQKLAQALHIDYDGDELLCQQANQALEHAKQCIGDTPIAIDYTATTRPANLARVLIDHGFCVTRLYADSFSAEDQGDFAWLQQQAPQLALYATTQVKMRVLPRKNPEKILAIGQKAAYFTGSNYFVNIVEGGGMYGFDAIVRLAALLEEAYAQPKDACRLIQQKGLGCGCCL